MSIEPKPFSEVKIGDKGFDYFRDHPATITDKGTIEEMCKKYPSAPCNLSDFVEAGFSHDTDAVVVRGYDNEPVIYTYAGTGITVFQ